MTYWKLKHPEKGFAFGSPAFPMPTTLPLEYLYTGSVPIDPLKQAVIEDGGTLDSPYVQSQLQQPRAHFEMTVSYGATAVPSDLNVPLDGSSISVGTSCFQPTSRGTVSLASANPADNPNIDPNYFSTAWDRCIQREAMRFAMRIMSTGPTAKEEIQEQYQAEGKPIHLDSSDEQLDTRIRAHAMSWYHPAGTAAMGKVVDTELRVFGVNGLRVVDASVIPRPIGTHLMGTSPQ